MTDALKEKILIADDTPENIDILVGLLGDDYDLKVALDGDAALKLIEQDLPDLILLDIVMPVLDGYGVCQALKNRPETADIPVIFLTALSSQEQEQKGLQLGAVDYISKPFNPALVRSRIANHLALANARKELRRYGEKLEELVRRRTAELEKANAELNAIEETKNQFLAAISHELRTPANGIFGIGMLAIDALPDGPEKGELQECFEQSSSRLTDMIDSAMHLARLQSGGQTLQLHPTTLREIVQDSAEKVMHRFSDTVIQTAADGDLSTTINIDRPFFCNALETLLMAAAKLSYSIPKITVTGLRNGTQAVLALYTASGAVSDELKSNLFKPFSYERSSSYAEELGLRLPLAEKIIKTMGGEIEIENLHGAGFVIRITLPLAAAGGCD